jgi:ComF family protein
LLEKCHKNQIRGVSVIMNYRGHFDWMSILPQPDGLKRLGRKILNSVLPGSCLLCGADSPGSLLCPPCAGDLPLLPETICPICADQTTHGERCGACLRETPHFEKTLALFRYDFPADRIIHALKYGHQLAVATWSAQKLAERVANAPCDAIIPLPLHPVRLRERGFNQSAEIAKALGARLNVPVDRSNVLRTRATPPQAELPHRARHKNVRGAFECRADFTGKRLLLIDDVMTTGATANECARVLKIHGAATVTVAVIARALKY